MDFGDGDHRIEFAHLGGSSLNGHESQKYVWLPSNHYVETSFLLNPEKIVHSENEDSSSRGAIRVNLEKREFNREGLEAYKILDPEVRMPVICEIRIPLH